MKLLSLPKQLLVFWYPESLVLILRSWKNILLYIEEDLAVGLMWKLLFTPLFHDSSFFGHILSFFFRLFRVVLGVFAFVLTSLIILELALVWFSLPVLAFVIGGSVGLFLKGLLFSGLVLFIYHITSHPSKLVWQIKKASDLWQASTISEKETEFYRLLGSHEVKRFLRYLETTPDQLTEILKELHGIKVEQKEVMEKVFELSRRSRVRYISKEHFLVATLEAIPNIQSLLMKINLTVQDLEDTLDYLALQERVWRKVFIWDSEFEVKHLKGTNRGWLGVPTPTLDLVSEDLTKKATMEQIPEFVGRSSTIHQIVRVLSEDSGRNVLLVGEPGSGKSHLVDYLAKSIVSGNAPDSLATKRLVKLDLTRLLSGIDDQGQLAERIQTIFNEVKSSGNIIIFIDQVHALGMGEAESKLNVYSLILPFIDSSEFQFIAATESSNYTRIIEKHGDFARVFSKIDLVPGSVDETKEIIQQKSIEYQRHRAVLTTIPAMRALVELSSEYIHNKVLPDSALSLYKECVTEAHGGVVDRALVDRVISEITHLPVKESSKVEAQSLLHLEETIHQSFINQEEAVKAVSDTLRRSAVNLKDKNRPIGSFMFVGPTGVGKTELAKKINQIYFQGKGTFLRFDMSEYQTLSSIDRLIGTNESEGQLTDAVRNNPYSLILLDEFEKADQKLLNIFLQILDDARITDGSGRLIDFTNTIIIATSNAASLTIAKGIQRGEAPVQLKKEVDEELLTIFKPELINRFDSVVMFHPLSRENLEKIVRLKLSELQKTLTDQGYKIEFSEELVSELTQKGFDPVMGARPLRRLIQDTLESTLSRMILEGKLIKGEEFIIKQLGAEDLNAPQYV